MLIYTVVDPDDGSGITYRWYGDAMVYVHSDGREIDAFQLDGPVDAPPTEDTVSLAVDQHHAARRAGD